MAQGGMDVSGTDSAYSNGSFESSLVRYPCRTVCNLFWGNRLASRPFTCGDTPISFPSLWPDVSMFTSLYRDGDMVQALPHIVRLLLATGGYTQLEGLLRAKQLSWEHELVLDKCSLIHMVCVLNCEQLLEAALKQVPQNGLLTIRDGQGHTPAEVCFAHGMRKLLKSQTSFFTKLPKTIPTGQQLTSEVKRELFNMASSPAGLYQLALILQTYNVNIDELKNEEGNHLLHVAVSGGLACLPNVFLLVTQYKASVHQINAQGASPLSLACQLGEERVAEVLLCVLGASLKDVNPASGWTPLHYSAHHNQPELIRMLLTRGADSCAEDKAKREPSFLAQQSGATECKQILAMHSRERANTLAQLALEGTLVVENLYPSDIYMVSEDGCTLLMKAVLGNHPMLVRALVNNNQCPVDFKQMRLPNLSDIEGSLSPVPSVADQPLKTAVTLAAANGFNECLQILLNAGAHPAIEDAQHWLPLHYACQGGHYKCVQTILDHPQGKGLTRLSLAKSLAKDNKDSTNIVTLLNQARAKRQKQIVSDRLFEIASSGDQHELYLLLEDGDDVNPKNETSDWPLLIAAGFGHLEIIKMLHKQGGHVAVRHQYNLNTPLHTSARGGHLDVVKYLLKDFCPPPGVTVISPTMACRRLLDVNDKNSYGATPLELAAQHGHMEVVRLLLDHGAVTTLPDSNNQLLSCKMFCGIQFLLEDRRREQLDRLTRALVDQRPLKEFSKLWQGPSDFNQRDAHWNTVLMIAARHAKPDVLEYLLQSATHYTSDMTINWASPQDEAASLEPPAGAAAADPVYIKRRRFSERLGRSQSVGPAAMRRYGYYGAMESEDERCISVSGDHTAAAATPTDKEPEGPCTQSGIVCLVNRNGCTALHCAVEGRNYKIIRLLLQADPLVANMQDKNGQTALHLACRLNFKTCVKALLECPGVVIDSEVKDNASNLAEELCVNGRLKKRVTEYRIKQIRRGHPARRPLPPPPHHPAPPDHYEDIGRYSRVVMDHRGHRRSESDYDGRISDWPVEPNSHYDHTHHGGRDRRQRRRAHSPPLSSDENYTSTADARRRRHFSPTQDPSSPLHRRQLTPIRDSSSPPTRSPRRSQQLDTLPESAANLRQNIHYAQTSDTDS